ncbi:MAG: GntR family transcriptional regulator [Aquabacterium sp.]|jgi:DNA-binding GntR family transcriptional regulator|nr:MAG: GntR family transcriptional regulator [Aquabacterium sp.]
MNAPRKKAPTDEAAPAAADHDDAAPGSLTDADIYDDIVRAIQDHRLLPGTKLVEAKLGEVFGVSRTRIRQVLVRLAHVQLVTLSHNRGATVAQPSAEEAREVFEVRRLLEPTLLQRFIARAKPADIKRLADCIDAEEAARMRGDRHQAVRLSGEFHQLIAAGAAHATLDRVFNELVSRTSLILMTYGAVEPTLLRPQGGSQARWLDGCSCRDHRGLLAAIRQRDAQLAEQRMDEHLRHLESSLCFNQSAPASTDLGAVLRPTGTTG